MLVHVRCTAPQRCGRQGVSRPAVSLAHGGHKSGFRSPTNSLGTPNTTNALTYFNDYVAQVTASTFFFEAFDEPWKANPQSVEPHFGLPSTGFGSPPPAPPAPAPEPSSLFMAVLGLGTLAVMRFGMTRRRERSAH